MVQPAPPPRSASGVLHTRYTTTGSPAARRFAGWRDAMGALIDVQPLAPVNDFAGSVRAFAVPLPAAGAEHIVFSDCVTSAMQLHRDNARIARDGLGHFALQVFAAGGAGVQQLRGRECSHAPGGIVALDLRQPFRAQRGDYHALALFVPRAAVEAQLPDADLLHGRCVAGTPLAALVLDYLKALAQQAAHLSAPELQASLEAALRLVLGALDTEAGDSPELRRGARSALMAKARACIEQHLADPEFGPGELAAHLSISRSALYRLFAPQGGVMAFLRTQRLRHALAALQGSKLRSVTRVAHDHGFGSASDFARAFRRHYGLSPSALQGGRSGPAQPPGPFPYAATMRPAQA